MMGNTSTTFTMLAPWLRKGSWSVLDQGLFALSNFAVNILLARWLTPEAYGAFTVAFICSLLGGAVHGGLFIEPMLVFGAGKFESRVYSYLRVLVGGHVRFASIFGMLLGIFAVMFIVSGEGDLGTAFAALAIAQAFITFLWLMRRACYVVFKPHVAAISGVAYLVLVVGGAVGLNHLGYLTGPAALLLMGAGALLTGLGLALYLGVFRASDEPGLGKAVRLEHWKYGRWASATGGLQWLHGSLPFLVLPLFVGLEGSGTLRALFNLAMPALQGFSALVLLAIPVFVKAKSIGRFSSTVRNLGIALGGLALGYAFLVGLFGQSIVAWMYRGQYVVEPALIWLIAILPFFAVASGLLMAVLRAQERPKAAFQARVGAVGIAATLGVALTGVFGVLGAICSEILSYVTEVLVMIPKLLKSEAEESTTASSDRAGSISRHPIGSVV